MLVRRGSRREPLEAQALHRGNRRQNAVSQKVPRTDRQSHTQLRHRQTC